jgi:hypothetical protein
MAAVVDLVQKYFDSNNRGILVNGRDFCKT